MNSPKVSVIIPAFNEAQYLPQTLAALQQQTYPNFEVVIVNNASADATAAVATAFIEQLPTALQRQFVLQYEGRKGTNFAREKGRQHATGTIIAMLDADCVPDATWIADGVQLLQRHAKTVAVTGPYYYYDNSWQMRNAALLSQMLSYPFINTMVQLAKRGAILIGGNAFIKADALQQAGGFNTNLTFYGDDVDLAARLTAFGWVQYSNRIIMKTSSRRYNALGFWKVNKKYQDFFWNLVFKRLQTVEQTIELNHPR